MNTRRNNEIKAVVTAFTITAALVSGFLTARDANAAPPTGKKSTVTVKRAKKSKPVYVKMSGNRRAAESRAQGLYAGALAQKAADEQAIIDARNAAAEANAQAIAQANGNNTLDANGQPIVFPASNVPGTVVVGGGYAPFAYGANNFALPQSYGYGGFGGYGNGGIISATPGVVNFPGAFTLTPSNTGGVFFGGGFPY